MARSDGASVIDDIQCLLDLHTDVVARDVPVDEGLIGRAERSLGLEFPRDYRTYLLQVGPILVRLEDTDREFWVLGVTDERRCIPGIPSVVWMRQRGFQNVSDRLLQVAQDNVHISRGRGTTGSFFGLDLDGGAEGGAGAVIEWQYDAVLRPTFNECSTRFDLWLLERLEELLPAATRTNQRRVTGDHTTNVFFVDDDLWSIVCSCRWTDTARTEGEATVIAATHRATPASALGARARWLLSNS